MVQSIVFLAAAAILSWLLASRVRLYALDKLLDIPNERSSHSRPTPRGGGLAIAVTAIGGVIIAAMLRWIDWNLALALSGGAAMIATVGWVDDHRSLSALTRFAVQFLSAGWAMYWLGGLPSLIIGPSSISLGFVGTILGVIGIVWAINLYNFVDGIDGLAAGEAVTTGVIGGLILLGMGQSGLAMISLLIAAAAGGFLPLNWAPAKLFMGDVGSGMLGYLFAVLAIASENAGAVPLLIWVLLLGAFVFDATVTLCRRIMHGEKWYHAHHSHAYQRMVQAGRTHAQVSATVLLINLVLALLAIVAWLRPTFFLIAIGAGTVLLSIIYITVERIRPMHQPTRG
ncbi:MAG TPA: glycosyltransferase family 4 protein [Gemmatimonadaceae bacterium]|jgi:Fuc2NAc and GlcNAc transferase|nr:glycosyltransferase family 4 protein [Gemmatimonadaceae bacterium]